jgi:hypothetical protein
VVAEASERPPYRLRVTSVTAKTGLANKSVPSLSPSLSLSSSPALLSLTMSLAGGRESERGKREEKEEGQKGKRKRKQKGERIKTERTRTSNTLS